ncbi:hypothetical protein GC167_03420 [bacterium]|nr:hypothetical protein [bacterium]
MEFALLSSQRTGSTLLIRSLDTHPEVFAAGELFHYAPGIHHEEYRFRYWQTGFRKLDLPLNKIAAQGRIKAHLDRFYTEAARGVKACGFKLMLSQIKWNPALLPALEARNPRFLVLVRQDAFASALSAAKAQLSGTYHSDSGLASGAPRSASVPEDRFRTLYDLARAERDRLLDFATKRNAPVLTYEHMTTQWDRFVAELNSHLEVAQQPLEMTLEKLSDQKRGLILTNEAVLRERFQDKNP